MKYVSDKPIDFTNDDWKQYTPRERARLEQQEKQKKKKHVHVVRRKSLPRRILETLFQIVVVVLVA